MTRGASRWAPGLASLALLFSGTALAQGGPPMITDDPGTPGDGHWEINVAATGRKAGNAWDAELPLLDINYGVGERIQLKYEVPWSVVHDGDSGSRSGLGNSMLGVKWRFFDAGETGWQMSTYPQVEFRNPGSRSAERGLAEEGTTVLVPFEFQRAFAALGVNFEVGRAFSSRSDDEWFGGVVIGHEFDAGFELMAEVHGESSQSLDRSAVAANVGTRIEWPHHGTLLVSLGRDLHNRLDERSAVFGYLGWQVQL